MYPETDKAPKSPEVMTEPVRTNIVYNGISGELIEYPKNGDITKRNISEYTNSFQSNLFIEAVAHFENGTTIVSAGERWLKIPNLQIDIEPGFGLILKYHYPSHKNLKEIWQIDLISGQDLGELTYQTIWQSTTTPID